MRSYKRSIAILGVLAPAAALAQTGGVINPSVESIIDVDFAGECSVSQTTNLDIDVTEGPSGYNAEPAALDSLVNGNGHLSATVGISYQADTSGALHPVINQSTTANAAADITQAEDAFCVYVPTGANFSCTNSTRTCRKVELIDGYANNPALDKVAIFEVTNGPAAAACGSFGDTTVMTQHLDGIFGNTTTTNGLTAPAILLNDCQDNTTTNQHPWATTLAFELPINWDGTPVTIVVHEIVGLSAL